MFIYDTVINTFIGMKIKCYDPQLWTTQLRIMHEGI